MALTAAEKQQRYRERHLGVDGGKERVQLFISVHAKAQLGRLARHHGYTVTRLIEVLAAEAERALLAKLPARRQTVYLDGKPDDAPAEPKTKRSKRPQGTRKAARRKVTV